ILHTQRDNIVHPVGCYAAGSVGLETSSSLWILNPAERESIVERNAIYIFHNNFRVITPRRSGGRGWSNRWGWSNGRGWRGIAHMATLGRTNPARDQVRIGGQQYPVEAQAVFSHPHIDGVGARGH